MSASNAGRRARELWAQFPTARIGSALEPLVTSQVDVVKATFRASPPPTGSCCAALNPTWERENRDVYACGLAVDRARLMAEGDHVSAWNPTLFDVYIDASEPIGRDEEPVRAALAVVGVGAFDYWLMCEVAFRLNSDRFAPLGASDDFVFYCFDENLSDDFQLGLAYSVPARVYERLAADGLVCPDEAFPGANWLDFDGLP